MTTPSLPVLQEGFVLAALCSPPETRSHRNKKQRGLQHGLLLKPPQVINGSTHRWGQVAWGLSQGHEAICWLSQE